MSTVIPNFKRTKLACYIAYFSMSSVFSLPPLLFVTLREMYDISYTLLGLLVSVNFCTQLAIDLIFTFFSKHFPIAKVVRLMPLLTSVGLFLYALLPNLFPQYAYVGLLLGTVLFSVSAGLSEVLLSPIIAAIPSENAERDMSMLHSLYAFGVVTVVIVSTLFFQIFGKENWMYLTFFLALLPVLASILFLCSPMPELNSQEAFSGIEEGKKRMFGLAMCVGCIFFGSCAENVMSNWISSYMETALHIEKAVGDILGMAMFAVLLGMARISYAKFGKNICKVLLLGMLGAFGCYLVAGLSTHVLLAFFACIFTGLFTAMLWPGTLIMMEEKFPGAGVTAFALMAAGGDLGASIAPQLMGVIVDKVSVSSFALKYSVLWNLSTEQIGLKAGMLFSAIFPMLGAILLIVFIYNFDKRKTVV